MGDQALKIYNGFSFTSTENNRTVAEILEKFDQFAIGEINEIYERYVFNNRNQHEGETFESYLATLRTLIRSCKYCDNYIDSLLRDRIVLGIRDASTQKLLLRERDLTLNKTIDICKATESAVTQEKVYRPETVNKLQSYKDTVSTDKVYERTISTDKLKRCKYCGTDHVFVKEKCPVCATCSKRNHFAKVCQQSKSQDLRSTNSRTKSHRPIHHVEEQSDSEVEWVNVIHKHERIRKYNGLKV